MTSITYANVPLSRARQRAGAIMAGLAILFLLFDTVGKLLELPPVVDGSTRLGYPAGAVFAIGVIELVCLAAYAVPRTAVLGAVLLTGYLGGAVATHLRVGSPLLTHTLFPLYLGVLVWGGLLLREERLSALFPLRR